MNNGAGFTESIVHAPRSNNSGYSYRSKMGMIHSAEFCVFFDDFLSFVVSTSITNGPPANTPWGWTGAVIDTGATLVLSTTAGSLGATGGALIASDGTSEGVAAYLPKGVQLTAVKRFFMEVRVQTSKAAETDVQFGLTDLTATTNPEDLWTTTAANVVAFGTLAGSAYPKMLSDKTNSGTSAQAQTAYALADTTWHILGIGYDGTNLSGYVDGHQALVWGSAATTIPTGVALAPFIGARTGATAGNVTTFDYVRYCIQR